jgi:hypothetical protein
MNCKICNQPLNQGSHSACATALERTPRRVNRYVPPETDSEYEDLRDIADDVYLPCGED